MMVEADRRLSNRFINSYLRAVEEQLDTYCLNMMLRTAELSRYLGRLPLREKHQAILASEFALFQKGIRDYYGSGAQKKLYHVGEHTFHLLIKEAPLKEKLELAWIRRAPIDYRRKLILDYLARQIPDQAEKDDRRSVLIDGPEHTLQYVYHGYGASFHQQSSQPICFSMAGMVEEAILWATGVVSIVQEITCRAAGGESCTFEIQSGG